jgi:predicted O-methyltransferase YrrM
MAILNARGGFDTPPLPASALQDRRVEQVIERMIDDYRRPQDGGPNGGGGNDPHAYADYGFSIHPDQGELMYLLCRSLHAQRVVDFATSHGFSALYLAAAVRDNGGGQVIGAELVPTKITTARSNLRAAGLEQLVEIRAGDARQTLCDTGGPVDFALIDGWPGGEEPSLALEVVRLLAPQLRRGALVLNDNAERDYLAFVRDPVNGFRSITLPLKGGTELSVRVA